MPAEVLATQEAKYSCLTKTTPDFVRNRNKVTLKHGSGSHDRLVLKDNNRSGMYSSLSTCLYRINFGEIPGMMYWKGRTTIMLSRKRRQNVGSSCIYTCKLRGLNDMLLGALETFQQRHYSGVPWASRHLNNSKSKQTKNPTTLPITYITGHFLGHVANLPLKLDALQWRNDGRDGVPNQQPRHCLLNRLFRSKKISKLHVTWLCVGNSPVTGEFPAQITRKMFPFDDVIMLTMASVVYGADLNWQTTQYIAPPRVNCRVYMVSLWKRTML